MLMAQLLFYFLIFIAWGSFLNVVAYRLIHGNLFAPRSFCPSCKKTIAWYDTIPIASWLMLKGACRQCHQPISILYPFIELLTALTFLALVQMAPSNYFPAYGLFFSALIVTIRTDFETMLVSRLVTLFLIPFGFLFSYLNMLPISLFESIIGSLLGGGFLYIIATLFKWITKKDGLGQGDIELLAFIGAFLGPISCWMSLFLGSLVGSIVGIMSMVATGAKSSYKIPFGPFLASGAISTVLLHQLLMHFFFYT